MPPLISVIIPVYNGADTIEKCISSLLSQTLTDTEIIVVNDGSRDNTADVVSGVNDSRIKIISIPNSGQGMARNAGIRAATGKYVGFVDADDTVCPRMYEVMCTVAEKHNADMVQCGINDIRGGRITKRPQLSDTCVSITDSGEYAHTWFYTLLHTNEVCNKIFRKSFLDETGIGFSDTRIFYSEDLKLNIDLLEHLKKVCFVQECFYNYNISESGHCLKNPAERIKGIFRLYTESSEKIKNPRVRKCIQSMAVINIMSYCATLEDMDEAKDIINSNTIKRYMLSSALYKKKAAHTLLMLALATLPREMKKKLIKKHYIFD